MNSSSAAEDFDRSALSNPEAAGSALPYATAAAFRAPSRRSSPKSL